MTQSQISYASQTALGTFQERPSSQAEPNAITARSDTQPAASESSAPQTRQAVPRVDIRLDYENLHLTAERRDFSTDPKALIKAVRAATAELGQVVSIVAYGDWGMLSGRAKRSVQRVLASLDVETRYVINRYAKNSADMKIADDVRTVLEKPVGVSDAVETVVLVTHDRDFGPLIQTAKARGRKVIVVGIRGRVSSDLKRAASEVRYLDPYLSDSMEAESAISRPSPGPSIQTTLPHCGPADALSSSHPFVRTAEQLVQWVPQQICYGLQTKHLAYVDTKYLAVGILMNQSLRSLGQIRNAKQAECWLEMLAMTGVVVKRSQAHPKTPTKTIYTWWLPDPAPARAAEAWESPVAARRS